MFYLDLFRALDERGVRYLLVGGLALNIHGVERATMDVDLMIALDEVNLNAFIQAAQALHLTPVLPVAIDDLADPVKRADWVEHRHMIAFALRSPDKYAPTVDILIRPGIDFASAWAHRIEKDVGGTPVNLASIDDLMAMKTGTGRLRDEADVDALRRLRILGLE
ncbi:MAG: hypothetical protein PHX10_12205 [Gallionellaceae bacterium]|nr:hypothetical protein [Gallionellaceae bacterium]